MLSSTPSSKKRYLAALALLCSGIAVGALGMHYWMFAHGPAFPPRPEEFRNRLFNHFVEEIHLTPEQVVKIRPEFDTAWSAGEAIRKELEPKMNAILDDADNRIRVFLTPEQRELLTALRKRMEEQRRRGPHVPPPPPFSFGGSPPPPHQ